MNASRAKIHKSMESGGILVNGSPVKASYKVCTGDVIECTFMKMPPIEIIPQNMPLDIVYEDEWIIVVNKPVGLVVHPGIGNRYDTLVNGLLWHLGYRDAIQRERENEENETFQSASVFQENKPSAGLVHRLDKDTTGLLIVAKYAEVHAALQKQFKDRTVSREYHTMCWGHFDTKHFYIEGNIDRDPRSRQKYAVSQLTGKPSKTEVWELEDYNIASYLKIKLHTGRTHQIRVHLSHKNRPVIGDEIYGGTKKIPNLHYPSIKRVADDVLKVANRQLLHAKKITFFHPKLKETIELEVDMSPDLVKVKKILTDYVTKST